MSFKHGRGSFINNEFILGSSIVITSKNPSNNYEEVFSTKSSIDHVEEAVSAARFAHKSWYKKSIEYRIQKLKKLKESLIKHEENLAIAIASEMGKMLKEAKVEAKGLSERIDLVIEHGLKRVAQENFYNLRAQTRYQPQGVLAIIGPFNFPVHLVHSHVIPSIILGNSVVIKPSEICPLTSEIYAQCFLEAGLDAGVVNIVPGGREVGQALCAHKNIDGVIFTGSYNVGKYLQQSLIEEPNKIVALEMGGKNFAVLMPDAHMKQALIAILEGAFLTTGQRCTATSRVLIHQSIFKEVKENLIKIASKLTPVNALSGHGMFGPLATAHSLDTFLSKLKLAKSEDVKILLQSQVLGNGAYVTPSVYEVDCRHKTYGYLSEELFGPNICLEAFDTLDQAINRVNESPYGLSNAFFSLNKDSFEYFYKNTKSGLLNFNRSTNRAFGQLPFGGVNKSGNQRPAGIEAVRYATFPVAICEQAYGDMLADEFLTTKIKEIKDEEVCADDIYLRHELQKCFENIGIYAKACYSNRLIFSKTSFDNELKNIFENNLVIRDEEIDFIVNKNINQEHIIKLKILLDKQEDLFIKSIHKHTDINVPKDINLPKSQNMLDQLYFNNFVPKDKKEAVIDLKKSSGPFLVSIDDDPLVIIDAASQIASLVSGFSADTFQNSYDIGEFDLSLLKNTDFSCNNLDSNDEFVNDALEAKKAFENFLHTKSRNEFASIAYASSGAEANEIALDLARQNGPGGSRIIAFEGSFHGRTILSLQATYNKEKRGPFVFDGYEATFIPFPQMHINFEQPQVTKEFLTNFYQGQIPIISDADDLLNSELNSLSLLKNEIEKGNILAVIIEPMQCEGGDKYASHRFFNALRGLTKFYKIPLIFDEVQTGFHLGSTFFWHHEFELKNHLGQKESPDCVSLGKKAQLGVCLSKWPNQRSYTPHVVQLKRGLLHALAIDEEKALWITQKTTKELVRLKEYFPKLVLSIRANGFAFAFDMPTNALAMQLINQRFLRGFMAYIAGEKTIRFRLNTSNEETDINILFENIFCALSDIKNNVVISKNFIKTNLDKPEVNFIILDKNNFNNYKADIERIEKQSYEANRIDTLEYFADWLNTKHSLGLIITTKINQEEVVAGFAIGGGAIYSKVDGPTSDKLKEQSFYSTDCVIDPKFRKLGLGRLLKQKQIELVKAIKDENNQQKYLFLCGRNRLGFTDSMALINDSFGAYKVATYEKQYGLDDAKARYYRLPLSNNQHNNLPANSKMLDCQNSLQKLWHNPKNLKLALDNNEFRPFACTKLTLSNWVSTNFVRYAELLRSLMPQGLNHAYFTSGRDEVVDKGLRSIKFHRQEAQIVIGFSHQYFGNITAAARSLSHDEGQAKPFGFFEWPKISHPAIVGNEKSLTELQKVIDTHKSQKILAIVLELLGEKSALSFNEEFLGKLEEIRKNTGIPLIFGESTSGFFRNGKNLFLSDSLSIKPNMIWFYSDGQFGNILVDDAYFVQKPLTLISTWDGDDISIMRSYYKLIWGSKFAQNKPDDFVLKLKNKFKNYDIQGMGYWAGVKLPHNQIEQIIQASKKEGVLLSKGFDNRIMVCPSLDLDTAQQEKIIHTLAKFI